MISRKGFTLIELMVVIFIVGILAAVAIPIMRGRIDAAKWSEGKSAAGSIRTAARALIAEKGNAYDFTAVDGTLDKEATYQGLGFASTDLDGRYFGQNDYAIAFTNGAAGAPPTYIITVTADAIGSPEAPSTPAVVTLDDAGAFTP
jgi:prepilin-type N-terminal cleavage/methylation domain-containing protein